MKRVFRLLVIGLIVILIAGCGTTEADTSSESNIQTLSIYTTLYPLEFLANEIGGTHVEVTSILPAGADPHIYEPTSKQMVDIANADLFIYNGAMLEPYAEKIKEALIDEDVRFLEATKGVPLLESDHAHEEEDHHEDDHAHEEEGNHEDDHAHEEEDHHEDEHAHEEEDHHEDEHAHEEEGNHEDEHAHEEEDHHEDDHAHEEEDQHEDDHAHEEEDQHEDEHAHEEEGNHEDEHAHEEEDHHEDEHALEEEDHHEDDHAHEEEDQHEDDHAHEEEGDHEDEHAHNHGDVDPHVWIDPIRMITLAENIKDELVEINPEAKDEFQANFEEIKERLEKLDNDFHNQIESKESRKILVTHAAYGYWEKAYGIEQIALAGLSTASESSQKQVANVIDAVEEYDLHHLLIEQNATLRITEVIQEETDVEIETIHNLSVLTEEELENEDDYFTIMYQNLDTLVTILK